MEKVCNVLKSFILDNLPQYLEEMQDEETPLPEFTDATVKVGSINVEQNKQSQLCFVVPDSQSIEELTVSSEQVTTRVDIFVFVRNAPEDCLFRQAMRYGAAIKRAIENDYSIQGAFIQCYCTEMEFFSDVEASGGKVKAIRIGLTAIDEIMEE